MWRGMDPSARQSAIVGASRAGLPVTKARLPDPGLARWTASRADGSECISYLG